MDRFTIQCYVTAKDIVFHHLIVVFIVFHYNTVDQNINW